VKGARRQSGRRDRSPSTAPGAPAAGRKDGECSNYGLVDGADRPWTVLTDRVRQVNARLEAVHARPDPRRLRPAPGAAGDGLEMG